jgi:predicted nucleic acid-binding protein
VHDRILIDSGPLVALFDVDDNHHEKAGAFFTKNQYQFISTLAVYTEVSHLLGFNIKVQQSFYDWTLHKGIIISDINQHDIPRIMELTEKYSDLPMDFADATLVVTAEKTGIRQIISLDKDFNLYRLPGRENIRNVFTF